MSGKRKKHSPSAGVDPGVLQTGRGSKKMSPLARRLLYVAVILVAGAQVLDTVLQVIPRVAGNIMTLLGAVLLVAFLVVQGRSRGPDAGRRL